MVFNEPWSKRHKQVTRNTPFSLSNSFAEPLSNDELINLSLERDDNDIVEQYAHHSLMYTPNGGSLDLREEIAGLYGNEIQADNIVVFPGAQVALQTVAFALLDANCHSIVFTPNYQSVQEAPVHAGSQVTRIQLSPDNGWLIDPEVVKAAIQKNTKYLAINEPFNPTGTLMSHAVQQQLIEIAEEHGLYIVSDEVYRLLEHNDSDRLPAMADCYGRGVSVVTLSKPWGGCGISIGWLAMQDLALKQKIMDIQYFGTACPSRASEIQGIMTLRASDKILYKNISIIRHNVALLAQFIAQYSEFFEWIRPNAGAVAYVKFTGPLTTTELGEMLAESGISIKPAYVFSEPGIPDSGYFRVGYGEKIMPKALDALVAFVEAHKEEWRR
ncbi:MAG: aminotransferase class I/II-fold pyridoxal phosphate-dependent enzyme [Marinomonadaceae bacterium]